ncbi:MAG: hypothetical protein K8S54_09890 [Spirochaetia bacterium]|nr:hypothetical protein [Spirochaetia bacterium]
MRLRGVVLLFGILAIVSGAIFYSVLRMTGFLLKQDVARQQLLNYELSSRLLEEKFKRNPEDYSHEIKSHVLETTILNFSEFGTNPGAWERLGSFTINGVRLVSGKEVLHIAEDERALRLLQYAFFLERSKRIEEAAKILESLAPGLHQEDRAFALLHSGYCRFLLGESETAEQNLSHVTREFRGTHFSRSAQTILDLMKLTLASGRSQVEKADILFQASRFMPALIAYRKAGPLTEDQLFRYARCLEETGKVPDSEVLYRKLTQARDKKVQSQAVRRLLILGNFLGQGAETKQYAIKQAAALKDPALAEIDEAERLLAPAQFLNKEHKAVTVKEILTSASDELQTLSPQIAATLIAPPIAEPSMIAQEPKDKQQLKVEPVPYITVILSSGRSIQTFDLRIESDRVLLIENGIPQVVPFKEILEIRAGRGHLMINGEAGVESTAMRREETFFRLSGKRNTFIPVDAVRTVRAIP